MTLKKFKAKTRRKSTEELTKSLINLNTLYYTALKYLINANNNIEASQEDEKFLIILQRKIEYTTEILKLKLETQHQNHRRRNTNGP